MGCASSSEVFQPKEFDNKVIVWFLAGGPGSPKHQIAQFLTEKYKFKYVSILELIAFEENSGSPETVEVRKALEEKTEFSSNLILRILRKLLVLYGHRKYLIDNFPRNMVDANQFGTFSAAYKEINFQALLHVEMTEEQMKESGMKALKEVKKQATSQQIEREVRTIIESYRSKFKPVLQHYSTTQSLVTVGFPNEDILNTVEQIENNLRIRSIKPVQSVPFFFLNGNDEAEVYSFSVRLSRQFALKFWSMKELKDQYRSKPEIDKYLSETKEQALDGGFLVELISKKIDKYNYRGPFLISHFPRSEKDVGSLRARFNQEIEISAYAACLHTPVTQAERQSFEAVNRLFLEEEVPTALITSTETSFAHITQHIQQAVPKRAKGRSKVILFPTFQTQGYEHFKKLGEWCDVLDFEELLKGEIKEGKLAADLLNSCLSLRKPVPSYIAGEIFAAKTQTKEEEKDPKIVVLKGFPQNLEQLKIVLSRSEGIATLCGMFVEAGRIKKNRKEAEAAEVGQYEKLCAYLQLAADKSLRIGEKTTYQELKVCIDSL